MPAGMEGGQETRDDNYVIDCGYLSLPWDLQQEIEREYMKWRNVKAGQTIKVHGEKVKVREVKKTEDGEVRVHLEGKGSHYQEIYDPNQDVK